MCLICGDLEDVTLVQVNFLIVLSFAQKQFCLRSEFHDNADTGLVFIRCFSRPLHQIFTSLMTVVFENTHAIHSISDHHIDEFLICALVKSSKDTGVTFFHS